MLIYVWAGDCRKFYRNLAGKICVICTPIIGKLNIKISNVSLNQHEVFASFFRSKKKSKVKKINLKFNQHAFFLLCWLKCQKIKVKNQSMYKLTASDRNVGIAYLLPCVDWNPSWYISTIRLKTFASFATLCEKRCFFPKVLHKIKHWYKTILIVYFYVYLVCI